MLRFRKRGGNRLNNVAAAATNLIEHLDLCEEHEDAWVKERQLVKSMERDAKAGQTTKRAGLNQHRLGHELY